MKMVSSTRTSRQMQLSILARTGGALLDLNGNVIGINAAKNASTEVEGMGFAIQFQKPRNFK